ncbi:MAG TPA: corrinoid protein [Anaerovoracaceae bacterium]|nr:corrinoid protein [Anaerovoracaceae bacterium]
METDRYEAMKNSILDGDEELAAELAIKALKDDLDLTKAMSEGYLKGIQEVGELYQAGEYFLPELVCAADAMKAALEILTPALINLSGDAAITKGQVVIATVAGDVHDIGKKIVAAMLTAGGYEVYDMGIDVPAEKILKTIKERKPEVLGLSALLTTTMQEQKNIIALLEEANLRDQVKVIIGGAPVSSRWAELIHADGYSDNAVDAVKLVSRLLGV